MNSFQDSEKKVFNFMDEVQKNLEAEKQEEDFKNTTNYKLKVLDKAEKDAKNLCLDSLFSRIYKDAVPLSDDYKVAHAEDIDACYNDFIQKHCPDGIEYYVKEVINKNNAFAKKVMEAVDTLVKEEFHDKAMNIEKLSVDEIPIENDKNDIIVKIRAISDDLSCPELSEVVKNNVKATALAEIEKAKAEKEHIKNLEEQLANDVKVRTPEDVAEAVALHDLDAKRDYVPSLFEAVVINKVNKLKPKFESGELQGVNIYNTMMEFGKDASDEPATLEELAFIEAVEEYTCLSILNATKMESFNKYYVKDLAEKYAQERF